MTVRTRSGGNTTVVNGSFYLSLGNVTYPHSASYGTSDVCEDVIGNYPNPNPLKVRHRSTYIPVLNGERQSSGHTWRHTNNPLGSGVTVAPPDPAVLWPAPNGLAQSALAWKILAESNPSAPAVSIPTFIGELKDFKDLPANLYAWGGSIFRKIALGHLTWRWAVKPMISDLFKAVRFVEASERRFRELQNLSQNGKGYKLRKRVRLGSSSSTTVTNNVTRHSEDVILRYKRTRTDSIEEWGSASWQKSPDSVLPQPSDPKYLEKLRSLTFKTFYGLTSYELLAAAWELTPWSWLIDWFSDVGDIIAGANNTIGLNWSSVCYMRKITSRYDYELSTTLPSWLSISGVPHEAIVQKERFVVSPAIAVSPSFLPIITNRQWSILGSLAVLKIERGPRIPRGFR